MRRKDIKENPEIRFPEFVNQPEYKCFGELLMKKARPLQMADESEYSLVTVKRRYGGVVPRGTYKGREVLVKSQYLLKANDFLISKRQICHNACGIVPSELEGSIVSNEYTVFNPKNGLDIEYFKYFCCNPLISHTFFLSSIGVHIEKMLFKVEDWLKWEFPFPSLPEQQVISSFLSAVDKKIEQLTRKKELLEQYKKVVMQKIFSQEIRFKDENGQDFPDWEERTLGQIVRFFRGGGFAKHEVEDSGRNKCIHYGELFTIYREVINGILSRTEKNGFESESGDILMPTSDVTPSGLATASCVMQQGVMIGGDVNVLRPDKNIHPAFLSYYINHEKKKIMRMVCGAVIKHIYIKDIKMLKYNIPTMFEQQKVASFLLKIDRKIESVQTQLTRTQKFKKGLLQKMFV